MSYSGFSGRSLREVEESLDIGGHLECATSRPEAVRNDQPPRYDVIQLNPVAFPSSNGRFFSRLFVVVVVVVVVVAHLLSSALTVLVDHTSVGTIPH